MHIAYIIRINSYIPGSFFSASVGVHFECSVCSC